MPNKLEILLQSIPRMPILLPFKKEAALFSHLIQHTLCDETQGEDGGGEKGSESGEVRIPTQDLLSVTPLPSPHHT